MTSNNSQSIVKERGSITIVVSGLSYINITIILILNTKEVFFNESAEMERVRISMDIFVQEFGSLYTLYFPTQSSHIEDPLVATL